MKFKKIVSILLLLGFLGVEIMPAMSIETNKKMSKKERKAAQEKQTKIDYINLKWWESFNDEYLEEYILKALENNNDLKIATLKVEESRQAVKLQFANELPNLTVGASPAITKMPGATGTQGMFAIPIIASYEIDIFLKNHDKTKSMKKVYEATQLKEQATYLAVVSAVGSTYYNIVRADKLIDLQKQIVADRKKIFDLMKLRNEAGITSTSDLVQAEKAYILSETDLIQLEKTRDNLLTAMAVLIGDSPENIKDLKRVAYDDIKVDNNIPDSVPSEVITSRPDYLAAEKMIEKAGIDVRVAKKEFLPSFNIGGLLGLMTASGPSSGMNWSNALAGAGILGMLPIFTGGRKIANLKIQKNRYEQILQEYQKTNLTAIKEVNDSLSDLKYDNTKYEKDCDALKKEYEDFGFAKAKFEQGVISDLDLTQKNEVLLSTQKLVVAEKVNTLISRIGLYKATAAADL